MPFFVLSGECSLGAHGLLRFRTNDVLLGTSGVGCAYLLCLVPPVFILFIIKYIFSFIKSFSHYGTSLVSESLVLYLLD